MGAATDLLELVSVELGHTDALDWFVASCLSEGGIWDRPRASDGITALRVFERARDSLRVAGQIWTIDQSIHVFWLELVREHGSDRFRWVLYFDAIEPTARRARDALHNYEGPEEAEWRAKLVGDATVQDDKLTLVPGSTRVEVAEPERD